MTGERTGNRRVVDLRSGGRIEIELVGTNILALDGPDRMFLNVLIARLDEYEVATKPPLAKDDE